MIRRGCEHASLCIKNNDRKMKRDWFARLHNHERSFLPMDYQDAEKKKKKTDEPENAQRTQDSEESNNTSTDMEEIERIIDEIKRENEEEEQRKSDLTEENTKDPDQEILEETESVSAPEKQTEVRRQYRMDTYEDDDSDADDDYYRYSAKSDAGDVVFRILAGILIFAICITAVVAVLLATGRLNGLIDTFGGIQAENAEAESIPEATPTVRVTLTPTPTETPEPEPTEAKEPTKTPTTAPDSSKAAGTESKTAGTDIMTFNEVNDEVTAKETTNLRNVPSQGEESFIIHILQNGEVVKRTGMSDEGWSRLEYEGQVVYAMSNLLTTDLTKKTATESGASDTSDGSLPEIQTKFVDVNEQVTPKIEVNLRLLPSVTNPKAKIVATVKNGEVFTRTGSNDELGWSRVEYKGQVLYCISSYVEVVSSAADAQPAAENNPQDAAAPTA